MSSSKGKKGKKTYYKRVHENELPENESSNSQNTFYCAAAENDHLGWSRENAIFDPMYTVNRRNRESDLTSKDSFFKKLKSRLGSDIPDRDNNEASNNDTVPLQNNLSNSMAMLGFGIMSSGFSSIQDDGPPSKKPKHKKSKKHKKDKKKH